MGFTHSGYFTLVGSWACWCFVTGFFHLEYCSQVHPRCKRTVTGHLSSHTLGLPWVEHLWASMYRSIFLKDVFILCTWVHCSRLQTHQKRMLDLIIDDHKPPHGYWELNLGPLEQQSVLFSTEPSLQPHCVQVFVGIRFQLPWVYSQRKNHWHNCVEQGGLWFVLSLVMSESDFLSTFPTLASSHLLTAAGER